MGTHPYSRCFRFALAVLVVGGTGLVTAGCGAEVTTGEATAESDGGALPFSAESCSGYRIMQSAYGHHGGVHVWFNCDNGKIHAQAWANDGKGPVAAWIHSAGVGSAGWSWGGAAANTPQIGYGYPFMGCYTIPGDGQVCTPGR